MTRVIFLLLSLPLLVASHCDSREGRGQAERSPPTVTFVTGTWEVPVTVEIAASDEEHMRGLMNRRELPSNGGMLFIFERQAVQHFWMKNTYIPLDIIFIDSQHRVVGIVANAEPMTDKRRFVEAPSKYVVEVNAGFTAKHGIKVSNPVFFTNVD